jgi:leucine dehydrogenase
MEIFKELNTRGHEQIVFFNDTESGLKGIVAIHSTALGPALGGCRMWNYKNEKEAIIDVLRLSKGMTYKASIAGLNLGGGKAVIIGDSKKDKTKNLFKSFGRFVEGLGGRYITAEDVGTNIDDMENVKAETNHVTGIAKSLGGSGDPSPVTAFGVYMGMKASVKEKFNKDSLKGLRISVQGLGHVGTHLVDYISSDGAEVYVTDIDQNRVNYIVNKYKSIPVEIDKIINKEVDIYAPCALGATVNNTSIRQLNCKIIAGAANNVLQNPILDSESLVEKNILYAPDYVINAGGLINVANELEGYNKEKAFNQAEKIYDTLTGIFKRAKIESITTNAAAALQAEDRIKKVSSLKSL